MADSTVTMAGTTVAMVSLAVRWAVPPASFAKVASFAGAAVILAGAAMSLANLAEAANLAEVANSTGAVAGANLAGVASGSERASRIFSHPCGDFNTHSEMASSFSWVSIWRHCRSGQWRRCDS
jgi:hypothetical protein